MAGPSVLKKTRTVAKHIAESGFDFIHKEYQHKHEIWLSENNLLIDILYKKKRINFLKQMISCYTRLFLLINGQFCLHLNETKAQRNLKLF